MGNDPVNGIDPSGGDIFGIFGTSGFLDHAFSGLEGAVVGAGISAITHDGHLARDVELGFGAGVGLSFVDENTLNWIGDKTEWIVSKAKWIGDKLANTFNYNGKNIFLIYGGVDLFSTEKSVSTTMQSLQNAIINYGNENRLNIISRTFNTRVNANVIFDAEEYVKQNYRRKDHVLLYGYSMGGVAANSTANLLLKDNISVDLLVTVDAAWGPLSKPIRIPKNVGVNFNYYQEHRSPIFSRGYPSERQEGNNKTIIIPFKMTDKTTGKNSHAHGTIDEDTLPFVINNIKSFLR